MNGLGAPIKYRAGYKYQLVEPAADLAEVYPPDNIHHDWFSIYTNGLIVLKAGYAWNGADVVRDTKTIMAGSAFHDAVCQAIKLRLLDKKWKKGGDDLLRKRCIKANMIGARVKYVYRAVRAGGGLYAKLGAKFWNRNRIRTAP